MSETEVGNVIATAVQHGVGLLDDILQDRNHVVARFEHPGIRTQVIILPLTGNLLVGDDITHHALMSDAGQRGIEVNQVTADVVDVRQTVGSVEYAGHDSLTEGGVAELELLAVILETRS